MGNIGRYENIVNVIPVDHNNTIDIPDEAPVADAPVEVAQLTAS